MCIDSDVNDVAALKVTTPKGSFYAVFPDDARHCELCGYDVVAIGYFKDNLFQLFKPHGHPLELEYLEPDDLMKYGNRPDLGIEITDLTDDDREELRLILL